MAEDTAAIVDQILQLYQEGLGSAQYILKKLTWCQNQQEMWDKKSNASKLSDMLTNHSMAIAQARTTLGPQPLRLRTPKPGQENVVVFWEQQ